MLSAYDRRQQLLETLCIRRQEKIANLAQEFRVCIRTIKYDIECLATTHPIFTTQGNGGGVHVVEGYYIGRKYLKPTQQALLEQLSATLEGENAKTMSEILQTFALQIKK